MHSIAATSHVAFDSIFSRPKLCLDSSECLIETLVRFRLHPSFSAGVAHVQAEGNRAGGVDMGSLSTKLFKIQKTKDLTSRAK